MNPQVQAWLDAQGWSAFAYQTQVWQAYKAGASGLIHAPTGAGKTLAAWLGPVMEFLDEQARPASGPVARKRVRSTCETLRVLWVTPMRALASDTVRSLLAPVEALGVPFTVEKRTADTASSLRSKQKDQLPTCLVTTPESLSVLLSYPGAAERFATLRCIVVDEWHELMSTKRGTQTELGLARLRRWVPNARTWGVSATLGNLDGAMSALLGSSTTGPNPGTLVHAEIPKAIDIQTVLPRDVERFPWAGHLGLNLVEEVVEAVQSAESTLLFTNTRSQAELWFRALLAARPDWLGQLALHHGSLDRSLRGEVEASLKEGGMKCVVCTSSLDLGVDFAPVDLVVQVGSPKGIARLMQRAGRSGHRPGLTSRVLCVPAHAFELVEFAAAREAAEDRDIEPRPSLEKPLDVLAQHVVTLSCAEPFDQQSLFNEVRTTHAYRSLSSTEWGWIMDFVVRGGAALRAYPQYSRVRRREDGRFEIATDKLAREHRINIGTINSDANLTVKVQGGSVLGSIEESFVGRLAAGDRFIFAGHVLQLVRVKDMTVVVKRATNRSGIVPRWQGGQMSLSSRLASRVRAKIASVAAEQEATSDQPRGAERRPGDYHPAAELVVARPILDLQARWSILPREDEFLIESTKTREGYHLFLFPFEGRSVHEGLGSILARRVARLGPRSIMVTVNDYGLELLSPTAFDIDEAAWRGLLATDELLPDMLASLNTSEMARRRFRDIARIAGLISQGFPGGQGRGRKTTRHLQASSELFFDVFNEFDPANLLLDQARREVLEEQLELGRLRAALERFRTMRLILREPQRLTPLAFPIWAESLRTQQVSTERWSDRVKRMVLELETAAEQESSPRRTRSSRRNAGSSERTQDSKGLIEAKPRKPSRRTVTS